MLFSSHVFLYQFLPLVLLGCVVVRKGLRNAWLLLASLFFYAWGEQEIVLLMLASIASNYGLGLLVGAAKGRSPTLEKLTVAAAVALNLGLLVAFKYWNFVWENIGAFAVSTGLAETWTEIDPIPLPIGISFFTFQAMSYVIDVRRGEGHVQRNPVNFATYIALFPQLIAGPIVRYRDIAAQLDERTVDRAIFASGVRRFIVGLGKKLLIADVAAQTADQIFGLEAAAIGPGAAWLGIVCYTLQIYFDFSGYSDMAIGLGRMFGFRFLENFEHPYISTSITEFWRRWHISLSSWFRDYLYIPLGGNRKGKLRTYLNLVTVFFLCGLWHGASWNFVLWGLFHGGFLVLERIGLERATKALGPLRHVYVLLVVMVGWVFFRAENLGQALEYLASMVGLGPSAEGVHAEGMTPFLDSLLAVVLVAGAVGATPWIPRLAARMESRRESSATGLPDLLEVGATAALFGVALLSALQMAASSYSPFIYFRF